MKNKVLVLAAHMDDEVLGCGGVILKHRANQDKVKVVFVAHRVYGHCFDKNKNDIQKKHALEAKAILGYDQAVFLDLNDERLDCCLQDIIIPLEKEISLFKPDIVYLPFSGDNNQDHRAVFNAARVALRPAAAPFIKAVYMYEVPSATEQSPPLPENAFLANYYVDITRYFAKKISAYNSYKFEKRAYPHPRSEKALKILAQKRGIDSGFEYAEAFMTLRSKWR